MSEAQKRIEAYLKAWCKPLDANGDYIELEILDINGKSVKLSMSDVEAVLRELDHLKNVMLCASNTLKAASDD